MDSQGQFLTVTVFGNEKMKNALDRLKALVDSEERLAVAITYGTTQHIAQQVDMSAHAIEEMISAQEGK